MPKVDTNIWLALKARVLTIPFSPAMPMAFPAEVYRPGAAAYVTVATTTAPPRRYLVGTGKHERTGTLTVTHVAPLGQDLAVYNEVAGVIIEHFPEELRMPYGDICLRVVSRPQMVDGYQDNGWWRTPVNIRWRTSA